MIDPDRAGLIERIMKLLAVAAGTSFAAEATTARALAAELMAKHNIDSVDSPKDRSVMIVEDYTPFMPDAMWEFILVDAVTDLCGCAMFWKGDKEHFKLFHVVGLTPDVEAAIYILAKLNQQRMRHWIEYKRSGPDGFGKFCFGFARGVEGKIKEILRSAPAIAKNSETASLWYHAQHEVKEHNVGFGRASSSAGLGAGESSSFYRGEVGRPQKLLK
jgi:hypothetical protein